MLSSTRVNNTLTIETVEYFHDASLLGQRVTTSSDQPGTIPPRRYLVKNHLGSTVTTVDDNGEHNGAVYDYHPYGKQITVAMNADAAVGRTFTGKELDLFEKDVGDGEDGEGWYYFGARYYDPEIGRWTSVDPVAQFHDLYAYAGNGTNPIRFFDLDGMELEAIQLKGLSGNENYYVDTKISQSMKTFVETAVEKYPTLSVNNTYRVEASSTIKTSNTTAKGLSRHQGGFAIDLNGVSKLSADDLKGLNIIAADNGFNPLAKQSSDYPHFDVDPILHGYTDLKAAVDENKTSYDKLTTSK